MKRESIDFKKPNVEDFVKAGDIQTPSPEEIKIVTFMLRLPDSLRKKIKSKSALDGTDMNSLIVRILSDNIS